MKINIRTLAFYLVFIVIISFGLKSYADTPISTPDSSQFCSSSGRYCATSRASGSMTIVTDQKNKKSVAWSVKEFISYGYISDNGKVVVSCYPGKNLVPDTASLTFTVIKMFYIDGRTKDIELGNFYKSIDQLPATMSHREWGRCVGFHGKDFEVELANGSILKVK